MALERRFKLARPLSKVEDKEVRLYYNNLVLYYVIKINYVAFMAKARKQSDEFGDSWKPLAPKTIKEKRKRKFLYGGVVLINIRTRALMNAVRPGKFKNGEYVPSEGQYVEVTEKSITFGIDVEYAGSVNSKRRVIVPMESLLPAAKLAAEPQFAVYLRRRGLL